MQDSVVNHFSLFLSYYLLLSLCCRSNYIQ
jgi:hypothetical protein